MAKRFRYTVALQPDSQGGTASIVMAVISVVLFLLGITLSYILAGKGGIYLGAIGLIGMLLNVCGFAIGLHSFSEQDRNHRFSTIGSLTNGIAAVGWLALFLIGV